MTRLNVRRLPRRAVLTAAAALAAIVFCLLPAHVQRVTVDVAAITGFYAGMFFVGGYHLLTLGKWRTTSMGVNVMLLCSAITGLFGLRCLALLFGDGYPGQLHARMALFTGIIIALIWRSRIMVAAQLANLDPGKDNLDVDHEVLEEGR